MIIREENKCQQSPFPEPKETQTKATNYSYNKKSRKVKKPMQIFTAELERKPLEMTVKHRKVCPQNPMSLNSLTKQARFPVQKCKYF